MVEVLYVSDEMLQQWMGASTRHDAILTRVSRAFRREFTRWYACTVDVLALGPEDGWHMCRNTHAPMKLPQAVRLVRARTAMLLADREAEGLHSC